MAMEKAITDILLEIGENPNREGLIKTPQRVAKAWQYITSGYNQNLDEVLNGAVFHDEENNNMIIVKDIEMYSMCEHHLLPFFGKCHVGYIPRNKIIGLSKIPRIVDMFARRLQVQERLTTQIAQTLQEILDPVGIGVVMEAKHLCSMMRGVEKQNSAMVTSAVYGELHDCPETRAEFFELIHLQK